VVGDQHHEGDHPLLDLAAEREERDDHDHFGHGHRDIDVLSGCRVPPDTFRRRQMRANF
jgi:hypothetical protein